MSIDIHPLSGAPPSDVPLSRSPLIRVIAQVRFSPILAIRIADNVANFQEAIRMHYPTLSQDIIQQIVFGPAGAPNTNDALIWRFSDQEKAPKWRVSLGVDFMSLETSAYESRPDFLKRLDIVLSALERSFNPGKIQRFGLRYVNRMVDEAVDRIDDLFQADALGIVRRSPTLGASVAHFLTDAQLLAEEGLVQVRWGIIPPKTTYDHSTIDAISSRSLVLDIDMHAAPQEEIVSGDLPRMAAKFSERIYMIFREMVTDEFLVLYGGKV